MFPTYDINYDEFIEFVMILSNELDFTFNNFTFDTSESKISGSRLVVYYHAKYFENDNHARLFVEIVKDENTKNIIHSRYSLTVGFSDTPAIFYFSHKMGDTKIPSLLDRWLSKCLIEINELKRTTFEYYFSDSPYINYGVEGASGTTADLFEIALFGSLSTIDVKKMWIARIRHISKGDLYRSFSYAILPHGLVDWLIFPDSVGLDSGGGRAGYEQIENSIKEAQRVGDIRIIDIDASIEEFKQKFKYLYADDFNPHNIDSLHKKVSRMENNDDKIDNFLSEIRRIDEEIEKQEYLLALRDMRALIESLCKYICRIKSIEIESENPNINNLSSALVENDILDPHIKVWFNAFYSIANEAAHEIDSSNVFKMDHEIKNDLLSTTIKLGEHLVIQLLSKS